MQTRPPFAPSRKSPSAITIKGDFRSGIVFIFSYTTRKSPSAITIKGDFRSGIVFIFSYTTRKSPSAITIKGDFRSGICYILSYTIKLVRFFSKGFALAVYFKYLSKINIKYILLA